MLYLFPWALEAVLRLCKIQLCIWCLHLITDNTKNTFEVVYAYQFLYNMSLLNLLLNILVDFTSGLFIIRLSINMCICNVILYTYLLNVCIKGTDRTIIKPLFYIIYFVFYVYQMKYQGSFGYGSDILGNFY